MTDPDGADFFAAHDRFYATSLVGTRTGDGGISRRLSQRYRAIVAENRTLYAGARVLDIASHDGRWSMAALDAGAAHVVGVEARLHLVANSYRTLLHYGVAEDRFAFIHADVFDAIGKFAREEFDLILCLGFFYHTARHVELFEHFFRLAPRHIILDGLVAPGNDAIVHFRDERTDWDSATIRTTSELPRALVGHPSPEMIRLLARHFGFTMKRVDWDRFGLTDWSGAEDYQKGERRTFVLTRT